MLVARTPRPPGDTGDEAKVARRAQQEKITGEKKRQKRKNESWGKQVRVRIYDKIKCACTHSQNVTQLYEVLPIHLK